MTLRKPNADEEIMAYDELQTNRVNSKAEKVYVDTELAKVKDYVVDFGSNANGRWEKWNSGKLEQWGHVSVTAETETKFGGGYRTDFIVQNYPIAFANTTNLNGTFASGNLTSGSMQSMRASDFTWTATSLDSPNRSVSDIRFHVIGRWK